jgi:hypothetical protein
MRIPRLHSFGDLCVTASIVLLGLATFFSHPSFAQGATGSLEGRVTDKPAPSSPERQYLSRIPGPTPYARRPQMAMASIVLFN